jgi:SAM-dependent methyltransferase
MTVVNRSRPCICGELSFRVCSRLTSAWSLDPANRVIVQCERCEQLTRQPSLFDDPGLLSSLPEDAPQYGAFAGDSLIAKERTRSRLARAAAHVSLRRVLDVGTGPGTFLRTATADGWDAIGLEVNSENRQLVASMGFACLGTDICLEPLDIGQVGLVHAHHVFEHLAAPDAALRHLAQCLTPGGLLVIEVPNEFDRAVERARRLLGKTRPSRTSYLEHEWFFTVKTLRNLLERAGYEVLSIKTSMVPALSRARSAALRVEAAVGMGAAIEAWARFRS